MNPKMKSKGFKKKKPKKYKWAKTWPSCGLDQKKIRAIKRVENIEKPFHC